MRRLLSLLLLLTPALAQFSDAEVLGRCQEVFAQLRPVGFYLEPIGSSRPQGWLIRVLLGAKEPGAVQPLSRLTLDNRLVLVPVGLEDLAQPIERPALTALRLINQGRRRMEQIGRRLQLANWMVPEAQAYRCFLLVDGRVMGFLRLSRSLEPLPELRWLADFRRSPYRWPSEEAQGNP